MARRRCKLSGYKQNKLLEMFVGGIPARTVAELAGINRHSATLFYQKLREIIVADAHNHINGIENFWNQAKRNLRKYNGIPKQHFNLFLKECEFRFNFGSAKQQLTTLKKWSQKHLI